MAEKGWFKAKICTQIIRYEPSVMKELRINPVKVIAVLSNCHVHINQLEKHIGFATKMDGNLLIYRVAFQNQTLQQLLALMQQALIYLLLNLLICKPGIS